MHFFNICVVRNVTCSHSIEVPRSAPWWLGNIISLYSGLHDCHWNHIRLPCDLWTQGLLLTYHQSFKRLGSSDSKNWAIHCSHTTLGCVPPGGQPSHTTRHSIAGWEAEATIQTPDPPLQGWSHRWTESSLHSTWCVEKGGGLTI